MPTIVHFEIPADDISRARKFYADLFGWKIEPYGDKSPAEYYMIDTCEKEGTANLCGGMMARQTPQHPITNYIGVSSVDEYVHKVESLGGRVVMLKTLVPGHGYFAVCLDTEGNVFGLWESLESAS
ncbi:MAG TPA: VOC family protein [Thermoguttaceae bacterium]|nr:VOC family protein [Thermoguttaceae bacterium]